MTSKASELEFYCMGCKKIRPIEDKVYITGIKIPKCRSCIVNMMENKNSGLHQVKNVIK